jgi:ATP-binding cassette subfamily B protein
VFGRFISAHLISSAVWLCSTCFHQASGMNCGITTVIRSSLSSLSTRLMWYSSGLTSEQVYSSCWGERPRWGHVRLSAEGIPRLSPYLSSPTFRNRRRYPLKRRPLVHLPWVLGLAWRAAPVDTPLFLLVALLLGFAPALSLLLSRQAVDAVAHGSAPGAFFTPLMILAGVLVLNESIQALRPLLFNRVALRLWPRLESMIIAKASGLSLRQFDQSETFDLLERASKDLGPLIDRLFSNLPQILTSAVAILASLTLLMGASPWLGLIGLLTIPPLTLVHTRRARRNYERNRALAPQWRYVSYLNNLLTERSSGTELRAYQLPNFFVQRWHGVYSKIKATIIGSQGTSYLESLVALLCTTLATAGMLLLVARQISRGQASLGDAVALTGALTLLSLHASIIASSVGYFWADLLPVADVHAFLQLQSEERPLDEGAPFPSPLMGSIKLENLSFQYPGRPEPILDRISLTIEPGEKIALVGPNGAGKSTLVKLLLGLYQPTSGRITIGGVDLQTIAPASLRRAVSCIFQEFARFDLTVAENVAIGNLGASDVAIAEAGEAAGLAEIAAKLPKGYQTLLGKTFSGGTDLSGGQWQRVALARAFVRDAEVIILDEPTAALDARAELELFGKFLDLTRGKTAVLISHRLGAARLADRIIVLDGGRIVEQGTHEALIAAGGLYADLFGAQAQFYEEEVAAL